MLNLSSPEDVPVIVIEDNVDGVAAAKTAGARVVGVPGAFAKQTNLRAADTVLCCHS